MHAFQTTHYLNNTTSIGIANLHVHLINTVFDSQTCPAKQKFKDNNQALIVTKNREKIAEFIHFNHSSKPSFTINCHVRIHKFSQENEAGKGGSRDNCVWHGGEGSFKAYLWEFVGILLCEIIIFEYCDLKMGKEFCLSFQTRFSRSAHASIKLIIVSQTLGMKNYEIIFAHA